MEVSAQEERRQLESYIESESVDATISSEIIGLLDQLGTGIYIYTEIQKHQKIAIQALLQADPISPAKELLTAKLEELGKI
jgi:hypothetical protein